MHFARSVMFFFFCPGRNQIVQDKVQETCNLKSDFRYTMNWTGVFLRPHLTLLWLWSCGNRSGEDRCSYRRETDSGGG